MTWIKNGMPTITDTRHIAGAGVGSIQKDESTRLKYPKFVIGGATRCATKWRSQES